MGIRPSPYVAAPGGRGSRQRGLRFSGEPIHAGLDRHAGRLLDGARAVRWGNRGPGARRGMRRCRRRHRELSAPSGAGYDRRASDALASSHREHPYEPHRVLSPLSLAGRVQARGRGRPALGSPGHRACHPSEVRARDRASDPTPPLTRGSAELRTRLLIAATIFLTAGPASARSPSRAPDPRSRSHRRATAPPTSAARGSTRDFIAARAGTRAPSPHARPRSSSGV